MADTPTTSSFKSDNGEDLVIDQRNLIAVVPDPDNVSSTILYVEQNTNNSDAPPVVNITRGTSVSTPPSSPPYEAGAYDYHVIVSTGSGTQLAAKFHEDAVGPVLENLFPKAHAEFNIHLTKSESTILELTDNIFFPKANEGQALRIILLSGDGGIIDLVNGLLAKPSSPQYKAPQVVLLPLGTANATYHSITAGKDNTWGLRTISSPNSRALPIFTASFSPGARLLVDEARSEKELPKDPQTQNQILHGTVVCSWGMHASLVADSDTTEYRKFGIDRFKMAAKEALYPSDGSLPHPYQGKVSILKGDTWIPIEAEKHLYVLAAMMSNFEKLFTISPATKPLDGSMHLVYFGPTTGDEAMRIMGLAYQGGKHIEDPGVKYEAIDGLRIEFDGKEEDARWRRICVDGKIVRVEGDGWVEVKKEERRVLDVVLD